MPVYNGNSKAKELYYGGTKIKEAYYGSTKVYSGEHYFCYQVQQAIWLYTTKKPQAGSTTYVSHPFKYVNSSFSKANSASDLTMQENFEIYNITADSFFWDYIKFTYYPSGDL